MARMRWDGKIASRPRFLPASLALLSSLFSTLPAARLVGARSAIAFPAHPKIPRRAMGEKHDLGNG
jgi:hypothetical protein